MANKEKQNLRYTKVCRRLNKNRYNGLTDEQKRYIKAKEACEQSERDLNRFWRSAPRSDAGAVAWDKMADDELKYFDYIYKMHERNCKRLSKIEESGIDTDLTLSLFNQINCNSICF